MNVKANNVVANLHGRTIHYGNSNNIRLVNTYNYVSNSDSKQNITTHCKTRLINVKNAEVWQNSFNCTDKDYEVRVVSKENVHNRGLKQTIFVVNEDSDNAKIVSDLGSTGKIKGNIDIIKVQVANITQWGISEDIEKVGYSLDLLANNTQSIVSSTKINDFKNLVIQVNSNGITESVAIQDKSLSDTTEDIRYQELKSSGSDISREVIQNSAKKLKAFIQASILDQELLDTYQVAKDIVNNNNFDIPVSQVEVIKNHMGVPNEKVVIAGMYSDQVIVDFSYNNSDVTSSYQKYRDNGGSYNYGDYVLLCNYYQNVTVEGEKKQYQYIIKLPGYDSTLRHGILSPLLRLNLKTKDKAVPSQNIPYGIIDFAELNVTDVDSVNIQEGVRSYINECYKKSISDLTEYSLEIKDITILDSKGTKWSLSIGLVDYLQSLEHQQIVLRMNNEFYKIDSTNLKLKHIKMDPNSFRYYQPEEQGLQIYHNQPIDKSDVGWVDFRDKSILDFDMEIADDSLVLLHKNNTIAKIENWNTYQPAREMMFAFNDTIVSNSRCIASTCNAEDIIVKFNKEKLVLSIGQLFNAVEQNNLDKVKDLINQGASINAKDKDGKTPLHYASQSIYSLDIVRYLISKGADIDAKDNSGRTPENEADDTHSSTMKGVFMQAHLDKELLLTVKSEKDLKTINDLIAKNIDDRTHGGFYYTWRGNLDMVTFLVGADVSVNATDKYGCTLLHWAALKGYSDIAKLLVNKGANVNAKDILGRTPMHFAVMNNHSDILRDLINNGANIGAKDSSGKTPKDIARDKEYNNFVQYLQQTQLSLDAELLTAVKDGDFDKVQNINKIRDIIARGANINTKDGNGYTLLYLFAGDGDLDRTKFLLENGASTEVKNGGYDQTPLHTATQNSKLKVVRLLLSFNANVNATDSFCWTSLHYAADAGSLEIVKVLVDARANLSVTSNYGQTPLSIARDKKYNDIVNYLEEELNKEKEEPAQRKRRHHHGNHNRHHNYLSSKLPAVDSSNQPEIAASSGTRPSSWINDLFSWVKSSVSGLLSSKPTLSDETSSTSSLISQVDAKMDVNGTIMLLDLLIRKVTGQKYISTADQSISPLEAQGYALNITGEFEKVVEQAGLKSGVSMHRLNIDYMGMQKDIVRKVVRGQFNEISGVLSSYLEKACPGREAGCPGKLSPKKFDKFMLEFNNRLNVVLNQSIEHNRDSRLEVDGVKEQKTNSGPQSYLSNASIQGHLTQAKRGNNLIP